MVHFTFCTLYFVLYTPHSTLDTPPPALDTAHFTLHSLHLTLYTSHCTLYAPQWTLYSPHSTLQTLHFQTLHLTLHFRPSQLCTFHTLHCMEPWPSLIFMFRAHTGLLSSTSVFFTALLLPALPKVHSDAEGGPLKLPQLITCQYVGYAEIRLPLRATVHTHMFSSSPLQQTVPQYVGWMCTLPACDSDPLVHVDVKSCAAEAQPPPEDTVSNSTAMIPMSASASSAPLHFTLYTSHFTLHFALYTPHFALYTPHSEHLHPHYFRLHTTLHSTLYPPHATLYTSHSTLYTWHSTLYTLHSTL